MKRFYYISIVSFYALIIAFAYARPLFQKFLAENQKQIEEGLERAMAIDGPTPALQVAAQKQGPKILVKTRGGRSHIRQVSAPKRPAPEGSLLVHGKVSPGTTLTKNTKKTDSPGKNPVS